MPSYFVVYLQNTYTTIQKFGVSNFFKEINTFIQKKKNKLIKCDSKDM